MKDPLSGFECHMKHFAGKTYWFSELEELEDHNKIHHPSRKLKIRGKQESLDK